jgi:putative transposase
VIATLRGAFPLGLLAQVAGVSLSGFYRWQHAQAAAHDQPLVDILQREHARLRGIYGYRRMQTLLRRDYGLQVNHKRVYRLCRALGLQAVIRRHRSHGRFGTAVHVVAPNVLARQFQAIAPNTKWVTDITYLQMRGRPYYLSVLLDLFNKEVVAYQFSTHPDTRIVLATVAAALRERGRPGLLLHSDQGVQYTTRGYQALLRQHGVVQSMSRRGNCLDNACIEGFFGHLKSELQLHHQDLDEHTLAHRLDQYIRFYNEDRYQRGLNDLSPLEFRRAFEARGNS